MPRNNSKAQREYRQKQATARQAERAQRSDAEQVTLLESRPGFSNRETARLRGVGHTPEGKTAKRSRRKREVNE